jgi:hypothetical protein
VSTVLLLGAAVTGCETSSGFDGAAQPSAAATTGPTVPRPDDACDTVDTLYAKMRVRAAHWTPEREPFDRAMADQVSGLADDLAAQLPHASDPDVQDHLGTDIRALNRLGRAMRSGGRPGDVLAAVRRARLEYAALNVACHPNRTVSQRPPAGTTTGVPRRTATAPASSRGRTATCRRVQDVVDRLAGVSAAWSPEHRPFDPATASKFRALGADLDGLAALGETAPIRSAIRKNAATVAGMGDAMGRRRRSAVDDSLARAQLAYGGLQTACALR